jgi:MYXO-CTERM domain-containing protein
MHRTKLSLAIAAVIAFTAPAKAVVIEAQSTATQTLTSPLFGGSVVVTASGPQTFTLDLDAGTASVTSLFQGTDLPNAGAPGTFLPYDLYNTATTGTVVAVPGGYNINFELLFELKITEPTFGGMTFETKQNATFFTADASLPFAPGTVFSDQTPPDTLPIFLKSDPLGLLAGFGLAVGDVTGTSSLRTVTINSAVPEPSSFALVAAGLVGAAAWRFRRRNECSRHRSA